MKLHYLVLAAAACATADARSFTDAPATDEVKLRSEGPAALARLLAQWDAMKPGAERDALADRIDRVAAQRYATSSRMYWYTDLATAKAEAKRAGKPILSLRLLGRLDEDLSCANSRYFRIALYANTELSQWLRDNFILHWSSERAVPRVTIDFGDGRKLERTITGNSIHYVLDADGRPLDALPGLYAAPVFKKELVKSLAMIAKLDAKPAAERDHWLAEFHRLALVERNDDWKKIAKVQVPFQEGFRPEAFAQGLTITKSGNEMPTYRVVDLGVNVGKLPDDAQVWAQLGVRLMPPAPPPKPGEVAAPFRMGGGTIRLRSGYVGSQGQGVVVPAEPPIRVGDVLDASSKALLKRISPLQWREDGAKPANEMELAILTNRFERDILADTAINEFDTRMQIHGLFANWRARDGFDVLNKIVYREVFRTSKDDAWLGLQPAGVTALPHDGLVTTR